MQVFRLYWKLVRANWVRLVVSLGIFLIIAFAIAPSIARSKSPNEKVDSARIGIINKGPDNKLSQHFLAYLAQDNDLVDLSGMDEEAITDSLYYIYLPDSQRVDISLEIGEGFTSEGLGDGLSNLLKLSSSSKSYEKLISHKIEAYFRNYTLLKNTYPDPDDLDQLLIELTNSLKTTPTKTQYLYELDEGILLFKEISRYVPYLILFLLTGIYGCVFISMNRKEIINRDKLAGLSQARRSGEMFLASLVFSLLVSFMVVTVLVVKCGWRIFTNEKMRWLLTATIISIMSTTASAYFFASISRKIEQVNFISNLVSLLVAFFSGVFNDLSLVSPASQKLAMFFAPIWQMKVFEIVESNTNPTLSIADKGLIIQIFVIQLLLGLAYYSLFYLVRKRILSNKFSKQY